MTPKVAADETAMPKNLGKRLRVIRERAGLSMKELATRMGETVHFTTVAKLETGKLKFTNDWLDLAADALGVSRMEFVTDKFSILNIRPVGLFAGDPWPPPIKNGVWVPDGYVPTLFGGSRCFAVGVRSAPDELDSNPMNFAVVDQDQRQLRQGFAYAYERGDAKLHIGIYRENPPRLQPWPDPSDLGLSVGSVPFTIVGEVVWMSRATIPSSDKLTLP